MAGGAFSKEAIRAEYLRQGGDPALFESYYAVKSNRARLRSDIDTRLKDLRRRTWRARRRTSTTFIDIKRLQANDLD